MNSNQNRSFVFLLYSIFFLIFCPTIYGQEQANKTLIIDSSLQRQLLENIIKELKINYVAQEKVKEIEAYMRAKLQSGAYDKIENARQLSIALTQDIRTASKDLHLFVSYDPLLEQKILTTPPTPSVELQEILPTAEQLAELRDANYNFRKVEILRGNIGYLDLRSFVDLNYSKTAAVAAMTFLENTNAIIIDLRKNPGGFINLETFLASYFYGVDPVELLSRYHKDTEVTVKEWTLRDLPGKRLPHVDLYILTSHETGSAGEGFSFILQQRKRAKLIGEKTSGAGFGNKEFSIGNGFVFFISILRRFDPKTGRGWQDVGVKPDVVAPVEQALAIAHREALTNLANKSTEPGRKQHFSWLAPLVEFETLGPMPMDTTSLKRYTGKYDGGKITVSLANGQLSFLGASGIRRKLHALRDTTFLVEDTSVPAEIQSRIRFVRNTEGTVTELRQLVADGREFPRLKEKE